MVLDHGLYLDLPNQLRQNYCALWCSFLVNDPDTAALVGRRIAGKISVLSLVSSDLFASARCFFSAVALLEPEDGSKLRS